MDLIEVFENHPYIAFIIYKEKIIYANRAFQEQVGYSLKELQNLSPLDLFPKSESKLKEKIKKVIEKRLKGEFFPASYEYIEVKNRYEKRLYVKFITQTIKYQDSYAGIAVGIDVTDEIRKDFLLKMLKEINSNIISNETINELYPQIVEIISKEGKFPFVSVILNKEELIPKYATKIDEEFNKALNKAFKKGCKGLEKLKNNEILVINDIENSDIEFKEHFLKNGYKSTCCVPIVNKDKLTAIIGICSYYKDDFNDEVVSILKEAKEDIEFAIKKEEDLSYLKVLQEALDKTFSWVVITDEKANILYANKSVEDISGYKREELIGKNPRIFKSGYHSREFYKRMWEKLTNNEIVETVIINKRKDGELFYLKDRLVPVITPDGRKYYISLAIDITKETMLQQRLKKDPLTGLYNRNEFLRKLEKVMESQKNYALILIDIKDFKIFNQLNGTDAGDFVLKKFAEFLQNIFYEDDLIARIGGDEFAILVEFHSIHDLHIIIQKLMDKLKRQKIFNHSVAINIGIALYPQDSEDVFNLLEKAAIALAIAKEKGDFTYEFFSNEINQKIIEYSDVKHLLQEAIKNKSFIYYFQPYVDSKTFKVVGAETLLRIIKDNEIIPPSMFIDYAENSGYIKEIEKIMFPKLLEYIKQVNIPFSFNISGKSLTDKQHVENLFKDLKKLPLIIELTEREIAYNVEYTKEIFEFFKERFFKVSIDDFGTGYSSLTYLKDLPADYIKIDMGFIRHIETSQKDRAIVETIIDFAHKFDLKVIAEGVENENQIKILQELNCDYFQGFYFAKPMPFEELLKYLNQK